MTGACIIKKQCMLLLFYQIRRKIFPMIETNSSYILLSTKNTSLLLYLNALGKVLVAHYGRKLTSLEEAKALTRCYPYAQGSEIVYSKEDPGFSLNQAKPLLSTLGKGDNFEPSLILKREDNSTFDFLYESFEEKECEEIPFMVTPHSCTEEAIITMKESALPIKVKIHFYLYEEQDVIGVATEVINNDDQDLIINKISSLQLPLINENNEIYSTYGSWAGELTVQKQMITRGRMVFETYTGISSQRRNPFFLLKEKNTSFTNGNVYGFNLIYSGNFENSIEMDAFENIRVQVGISSTQFEKKLTSGENFFSPMAVMTYSHLGINEMSSHFHNFVNQCIIPSEFYLQDRPITYNNWEATMFQFNEKKILSLMKKASKLGIELFVLDDGWFGKRNDDHAGLGDWIVNKQKLPSGLKGLSDAAKKNHLKFGIWMEPEMVNPDSDTYRAHPDWVIQDRYHPLSFGRNQLILDLTKQEVQDFIVTSVSNTLDSGDISYIKWDCNRSMSDYLNQSGTFFYDYYCGLYQVLRRIRARYPHVLFENCASGGNRFDLAMLSFFAQSWQSDDTDSYQRTLIQEGALLGYPLSVLSNHVSAKTSNQMLRYTSFDTKFDVACFGVLGYELDLDDLSSIDEEIISKQIQFYKENRKAFQWGKVFQSNLMIEAETKRVQISYDHTHFLGMYQTIQKPHPKEGHLKLYNLQEDTLYHYEGRQESIPLRKFGALINMVSPVHINPDGSVLALLEKKKDMKSEKDEGILSGSLLMSTGAVLSQEWSGVGYDERIRLISDFGARLYKVTPYDTDISK